PGRWGSRRATGWAGSAGGGWGRSGRSPRAWKSRSIPAGSGGTVTRGAVATATGGPGTASAGTGPRTRLSPMPIRRTEFESGLRVVTERIPGVRSVALGFWVLAGSRDEPPPISGSSHFLEHLLFKGTKTRTARDIAEAFDAVGGDVNAFTAKEYTCFYSRVRDRDLPMAVEIGRAHV